MRIALILFSFILNCAYADVNPPADLANVNTLTRYQDGPQRILELNDWAQSNVGRVASGQLQVAYAKAQNKIFVKTQQLYIESVRASLEQNRFFSRTSWSEEATEDLMKELESKSKFLEELTDKLNSPRLQGVLISELVWQKGGLESVGIELEGAPRYLSKSSGIMAPTISQRQNYNADFRAQIRNALKLNEPPIDPIDLNQLRFAPGVLVQSLLGTTTTPVRQYLDTRDFERSLNLGARSSQSVDLSASFSTPTSQLLDFSEIRKTFTCAGFAIANAMNYYIRRFPVLPLTAQYQVDPWRVFADAIITATVNATPTRDQIISYSESVKSMRVVPDQGVSIRDYFDKFRQAPRTNLLEGNRTNAIKLPHLKSLEEFDKSSKRIDPNLLRKILNSGHVVLVGVNWDGRVSHLKWYTPRHSNIPHALVVVGHGTAFNPIKLAERPYFIVRDSLTTNRFHYFVDAEDLADQVFEVHVLGRPDILLW